LVPARAEVPTPARTVRRARSIVVIEDNPSVGATLQAALEQAGHSVRLFADGPSTLAGVATLRPDVLLIDIGLPGMDGYQLAAKLKQHANTKDAHQIAVSGFERRADGGTFNHYLRKPPDLAELLAVLDQLD
jgi:two-component system CheB/CheR fusion protein